MVFYSVCRPSEFSDFLSRDLEDPKSSDNQYFLLYRNGNRGQLISKFLNPVQIHRVDDDFLHPSFFFFLMSIELFPLFFDPNFTIIQASFASRGPPTSARTSARRNSSRSRSRREARSRQEAGSKHKKRAGGGIRRCKPTVKILLKTKQDIFIRSVR